MNAPFDRLWIQSVIPHRGAMLLVDAVSSVVSGRSAVVCKWALPGGSDTREIPLAIQLESFNQACAVLVLSTWAACEDVRTSEVPMLAAYRDIVVHAIARESHDLVHEVRMVQQSVDAMVLEGRTTCDGREVMRASYGVVARRPVSVLAGAVGH